MSEDTAPQAGTQPAKKSAWRTGCAIGCALFAFVTFVCVLLGLRWFAKSSDRGHQLEQLAHYLPHDPIPAHYAVKGFKVPFNPVRTWMFDSSPVAGQKPGIHAVLLHASGQAALAFRDELRSSTTTKSDTIKGTLSLQGRELVCYRLGRWKPGAEGSEAAKQTAPIPAGEAGADAPESDTEPGDKGAESNGEQDGKMAFGLEKFLEAGATVAIVELSREGSGELLLAILLMSGSDDPNPEEFDRQMVEFLTPFHIGPQRNEDDP